MRKTCLALLATLLAAPISAQEYRWEQNDQLMVKFRVHRKLQPVPIQIGSADPHTRMQFKPDSDGDYIRGQYSWELFVLEFPKANASKQPAGGEGGEGEGGTTTGEKPKETVIDSKIRAADFHEWVTEKDPSIKARTFQEKGTEVGKKGRVPAHTYYEYSDEDSRFGFWYRCAAVYDYPDRQVVLLGNIPAVGNPKPKEQWYKWVQKMITSIADLNDKDVEGDDGGDEEKDQYADEPWKQKELDKAKKNIQNLDGWDYFTSPNYICLFSWKADKPEKRKPADAFAHEMVDKLEAMRDLYTQEFKPHDKMVQLYSILRICNNYDDFTKYSGMGGGVVGYFSPSSKELVIFDDKDRIFGKKEETIYSTAMHEGWHQYGHTYFGEGVELHRWFDEGTGDWFGSWAKKGKKWAYTMSKERYPGIRAQVLRKTYINPRELVGWERSKFYGSPRVVDHYEQAYSMIDFMRRGKDVMGKKFDPAWGEIPDRYRATMLETKDPKKAVEKACEGIDWDKFEAAWVDWVKKYMK